MSRRLWGRWLGMACLALAASPLDARTLEFETVAVEARLDAEGVLHVRERLDMVFSGNWNGGERGFRVDLGQKLTLDRLTRVDPATGARVELSRGDLSRVDHYDWGEGNLLRWRARRPSDPLFDATRLVYELEYRYKGVVRHRDDGSYELDHDFGIPILAAPIRSFQLDLALDPVWEPRGAFDGALRLEGYEARGSHVVTVDLAFDGHGRPSAVLSAPPRGLRFFLVAAAFLAVAGFWLEWFLSERAAGRFVPLPRPGTPARDWLEQHVFRFLPEEAGAFWDGKVGAPEVAATLARMVSEGKLESSVDTAGRKPVLHLRLLVLPAQLSGYEKTLIKKLFWEDRRETDTTAIRKHYKKTGFNPAKVIEPGILAALQGYGLADTTPAPGRRRSGLLFAALPLLLGVEWLGRGSAAGVLAGIVCATLLLYVLALGLGTIYRSRVDRLGARSLGFLIPSFLMLAFLAVLAIRAADLGGLVPGFAGLLAMIIAPVAAASSLSNHARSREGPRRLEARRKMAGAREHFRRELERAQPDLEDAWYPYLLAFGLERRVGRWFDSFAGSAAGSTGSFSPSSVGSGSSGGSGSGWSGGGGAFGGAGASAAWGVAAAGMAAGVATPSSSGSGGSSGGGSSGGGSAGGW